MKHSFCARRTERKTGMWGLEGLAMHVEVWSHIHAAPRSRSLPPLQRRRVAGGCYASETAHSPLDRRIPDIEPMPHHFPGRPRNRPPRASPSLPTRSLDARPTIGQAVLLSLAWSARNCLNKRYAQAPQRHPSRNFNMALVNPSLTALRHI